MTEENREEAKSPSSNPAIVVPKRSRRARGVEDDEPGNPWVRRGLVIGLAAAGASIVALVLGFMQDGAIYSKPVDELLANKSKFAGRAVRAEGNLVHGTLVKRDQPCEYRFTLTAKGQEMPVVFPQCVVPDTFRDVQGMDVGVTVEGELAADGHFEATTVLAKCPSKYEMKQMEAQGKKMPTYTAPTEY